VENIWISNILEARRIGEGQILEGAREIIKAGDFDG